jgi:hypothetical protein
MADLVNSTHKGALGVRNQEPSHLDGGSYETLGGPPVGGVEANTVKINSAAGVKDGDTTIPKAVGPEQTHRGELKTEDSDPDVDFGDGDDSKLSEADDLDDQLDKFDEAVIDVDTDADDKDDDDKKKVAEDFNFDKDKKDDDDKDDAKNEDVEIDVKKDGDDKDDDKKSKDDDKGGDDKKPAFLKKDVKEAFKVRIKMPSLKLTEAVMPAKNQKQVEALFEQAVRSTTKQVNTQLAAHYRKLFEEKSAARDAATAKKMDAYLSYVVEEWVKQNKVAIRQSLRFQLAENFLDGLKTLFKEHYIDVPESKVDVVKKLTEQVEKLKAAVNEQHTQKLQLRKLAESANKARIVAEFGRTLSEAQVSKLTKLAEDVQYKNAKDFRARLTVIKESYFTNPTKKNDLPREDVQVITESGKRQAVAFAK